MNRRQLIGAMSIASLVPRVIAAAAAAPALGRDGARTLGYLSNGADGTQLARLLAARGHAPGRDLRIVVETTKGDDRELEERARALLAARPDVLVAWGARNINALARLTRTIPIVCGGTADPVGIGYAKSIRRPGGNITGLSYGVPEMAPIIVGLMRAARPELKTIATFVREGPFGTEGWAAVIRSIEVVARGESIAWQLTAVKTFADYDKALAALDPRTAMAYLVTFPEYLDERSTIEALIRRRLASSANGKEFVRRGGLMHYSVDHADELARVAAIIDSLLRGANPAELPFELPDRTTFVLNRATAKAIGLTLSPELLARATEIVG